ncbi:MAG: arsenic resistance protein [Syntrophomonadaceae bacterium]|jgi:ACR3 family arsenite efflux pump ArsB|nr:arsenic resistance protein [Syntrophomonadaceae bacterium]
MSVLAKLQPVFIIFSAFLGIFLGKTSVNIEQRAGGFIEIFLMSMLFFVFLGVDIREITKSFTNLKFSLPALAINFLWTPVFALLLAGIFFPARVSLQIGFIMLMVTPCTDWYLIFAGLAKGNVTLGASVLPLNLILQIILLPVYLFIFMGQAVSFDFKIIGQSIILVLVIPLAGANIVKILIREAGRFAPKSSREPLNGLRKLAARAAEKSKKYFDLLREKNDDIQFILLCCAIVSMFASQGSVLLANLGVFTKLLFPLMVFFIINFLIASLTGKKLQLPFQNTVALIFASYNNCIRVDWR